MKIKSEKKYDFQDLSIEPKRSDKGSRSEIILEREIIFLHSGRKWTGIPIIASNMDTIGTFKMHYALRKYKMITCLSKHYNIEDYPDDLDPDYYSLSTGINDNDFEKLKLLIDKLKPYFVTVDVPNGYSNLFVEFCKGLRNMYPKLTIFAGNVATGDMVQELIISAKVDVVKCGIGSGSVCSTRLKTGVGVPQLSVCIECSEVANGLRGHIISDGGCTGPNDIAKAFGGGAHFVMLGGMLSGHDQSGGDISESKDSLGQIKKYKLFYGMSSSYAQDKYNGGLKHYRSSEGKVKRIPYKGDVCGTIQDILGGLRSTGTYIGASRIKDFGKCCTFIKVRRQINTIYDDKKYDILI